MEEHIEDIYVKKTSVIQAKLFIKLTVGLVQSEMIHDHACNFAKGHDVLYIEHVGNTIVAGIGYKPMTES